MRITHALWSMRCGTQRRAVSKQTVIHLLHHCSMVNMYRATSQASKAWRRASRCCCQSWPCQCLHDSIKTAARGSAAHREPAVRRRHARRDRDPRVPRATTSDDHAKTSDAGRRATYIGTATTSDDHATGRAWSEITNYYNRIAS